MLNRRILVRTGLASLSVASGLSPAVAFAASPVRERARVALRAFLDQAFITQSMQCGTRRGDGVPEEAEVRVFLQNVLDLAVKGQAQIFQGLAQHVRRDHEAGQTMIIDGWVYTRTEALASAAHILLIERDCRLPDQVGD